MPPRRSGARSSPTSGSRTGSRGAGRSAWRSGSRAWRSWSGVARRSKPGGSGLAVVAALGATLSYGAAASYTRRFVSGGARLAVVALGVLCTAVAYVLYFRLIANVGPARAIAVTFLIPPFAVAWGALFLREPVTVRALAGSAIVLAGTALATGLVRLPGIAAPRRSPGSAGAR